MLQERYREAQFEPRAMTSRMPNSFPLDVLSSDRIRIDQ
jgi:hypothetical protein